MQSSCHSTSRAKGQISDSGTHLCLPDKLTIIVPGNHCHCRELLRDEEYVPKHRLLGYRTMWTCSLARSPGRYRIPRSSRIMTPSKDHAPPVFFPLFRGGASFCTLLATWRKCSSTATDRLPSVRTVAKPAAVASRPSSLSWQPRLLHRRPYGVVRGDRNP
jgi:hypothetical protein